MGSEEDFFSRWSRRKAQATPAPARAVPPAPERDAPAPATGPTVEARSDEAAEGSPPDGLEPARSPEPAETRPPSPTLDEARALTPQDDFRRFVTPQVDPQVRNTALKRLFADPHFNVMDRLDIYIDDYNTPDPLPAGMLRQMAQSAALGLFSDEPAPAPAGDDPAGHEAQGDAAARGAPAEPAPQAAPDTPRADADADADADATAPAQEGPADEDPDLRLQPNDAAGHPGDRPHPGGDAGREP